MKRNLENEEGEEEDQRIQEKKAKSVELELHGSFEEHKEQVKIFLTENPDYNLLTAAKIMIQNSWYTVQACRYIELLTGRSKDTLRKALERGQTALHKNRQKKKITSKSETKMGNKLEYHLIPTVVRDYFGKGPQELLRRLGSKAKIASQKLHKNFLFHVAKQMEDGKYPWFVGTPEDLWGELLQKTKRGFAVGKKAEVREILTDNTGLPGNHVGRSGTPRMQDIRKYILKNNLHRSDEFPMLKFICDICKIQGHDEGQFESNWTTHSGESLMIGGGNPEVIRLARVQLCLDHFDGNSANDLPENLRWLCYNCDPFTPHFRVRTGKPRRDLKIILEREERYKQKYDDHTCQLCFRFEWTTKIDDEWHTFMIPLETDHIDGNSKNDVSSNLRRICRQCHANTPTFNKNTMARYNIQKEEENKLK